MRPSWARRPIVCLSRYLSAENDSSVEANVPRALLAMSGELKNPSVPFD
jgi:hypothetical protein